MSQEYIEKHGEYTLSDSLYGNVVAGRDIDGRSDFDKIWIAQKKVVTDLAENESCVIVGRCADYLLKDIANCLTVFIHASNEKRAERIVSVYGQREESPAARLHEKDKKRKAYYELYTGTVWGTSENYNLCLDSGVLGIEKCIETIKAYTHLHNRHTCIEGCAQSKRNKRERGYRVHFVSNSCPSPTNESPVLGAFIFN